MTHSRKGRRIIVAVIYLCMFIIFFSIIVMVCKNQAKAQTLNEASVKAKVATTVTTQAKAKAEVSTKTTVKVQSKAEIATKTVSTTQTQADAQAKAKAVSQAQVQIVTVVTTVATATETVAQSTADSTAKPQGAVEITTQAITDIETVVNASSETVDKANAEARTQTSSGSVLTRYGGVNYFNGHKETWYSERVLPGSGLSIPGRYTDDAGLVRDSDGYICVASSNYSRGTIVETSLGIGKVYDSGCPSGVIDIYTNW